AILVCHDCGAIRADGRSALCTISQATGDLKRARQQYVNFRTEWSRAGDGSPAPFVHGWPAAGTAGWTFFAGQERCQEPMFRVGLVGTSVPDTFAGPKRTAPQQGPARTSARSPQAGPQRPVRLRAKSKDLCLVDGLRQRQRLGGALPRHARWILAGRPARADAATPTPARAALQIVWKIGHHPLPLSSRIARYRCPQAVLASLRGCAGAETLSTPWRWLGGPDYSYPLAACPAYQTGPNLAVWARLGRGMNNPG